MSQKAGLLAKKKLVGHLELLRISVGLEIKVLRNRVKRQAGWELLENEECRATAKYILGSNLDTIDVLVNMGDFIDRELEHKGGNFILAEIEKEVSGKPERIWRLVVPTDLPGALSDELMTNVKLVSDCSPIAAVVKGQAQKALVNHKVISLITLRD